MPGFFYFQIFILKINMRILISEEFKHLVDEAYPTQHFNERLKSRLDKLELSPDEYAEIMDKVQYIKNKHFTPSLSYGVLIHRFVVDKGHKYAHDQGSHVYYRVPDESGVDSTGDELWAVVRTNKLNTFMLKKSGTKNTIDQLKEFMRVDKIVFIK
jgi:hypothetical protein